MPLLPNSTAVTALMDKLFGPYKGACRERSQVIYAKHLPRHSQKLSAIKEKMSRNEEVSNEEKKSLKQAVRMDPSDVGKIVFGDLQEDGRPHPDSPFAVHFTKEKIAHGAEEVSYILSLNALNNCTHCLTSLHSSSDTIRGVQKNFGITKRSATRSAKRRRHRRYSSRCLRDTNLSRKSSRIKV